MIELLKNLTKNAHLMKHYNEIQVIKVYRARMPTYRNKWSFVRSELNKLNGRQFISEMYKLIIVDCFDSICLNIKWMGRFPKWPLAC